MDPIKVLVVNEVRLIGNLFASVLKDESDIEVLGCPSTAEVVLVSVGLPCQGALNLTRAIMVSSPDTKVLAVGLSEENQQDTLKYIEAGASGYILKDSSLNELINIIRLAKRGDARISTRMAGP